MLANIAAVFVCLISFTVAGREPTTPQSVIAVLEKAGISYRSVSADSNGCLIVNLSGGNISDLSVLRGLPISVLSLRETKVTDLAPLSGMPLTVLDVSCTLVSNLTPLAKVPLRMLNCGLTKVDNLDPLRRMPLSVLVVEDTKIASLESLRKVPLHSLDISETDVVDLSSLKKMPLEALRFSPERIKVGMDVLRNLASLKEVGVSCEVLPVQDFWRKYDNGDFRLAHTMSFSADMLEPMRQLKEDGAIMAEEYSADLSRRPIHDKATGTGRLTRE